MLHSCNYNYIFYAKKNNKTKLKQTTVGSVPDTYMVVLFALLQCFDLPKTRGCQPVSTSCEYQHPTEWYVVGTTLYLRFGKGLGETTLYLELK